MAAPSPHKPSAQHGKTRLALVLALLMLTLPSCHHFYSVSPEEGELYASITVEQTDGGTAELAEQLKMSVSPGGTLTSRFESITVDGEEMQYHPMGFPQYQLWRPWTPASGAMDLKWLIIGEDRSTVDLVTHVPAPMVFDGFSDTVSWALSDELVWTYVGDADGSLMTVDLWYAAGQPIGSEGRLNARFETVDNGRIVVPDSVRTRLVPGYLYVVTINRSRKRSFTVTKGAYVMYEADLKRTFSLEVTK